jgi:hypothetical protein
MPRDLPSWAYFLFLVPCNLGISFTMPSALLSILATSLQTEQAVATSTLIMWRSLGSVFGVASSSLLVQNFLYYFLEKNITGPERREVIDMVRKSVTSIFELDELRQRQGMLFRHRARVTAGVLTVNSDTVLRSLAEILLHVERFHEHDRFCACYRHTLAEHQKQRYEEA